MIKVSIISFYSTKQLILSSLLGSECSKIHEIFSKNILYFRVKTLSNRGLLSFSKTWHSSWTHIWFLSFRHLIYHLNIWDCYFFPDLTSVKLESSDSFPFLQAWHLITSLFLPPDCSHSDLWESQISGGGLKLFLSNHSMGQAQVSY